MHNSNVSGQSWMRDIFGAGKSGKSNGLPDIFDIKTSFRDMLANKSGIQDALDSLAERFPNAKIAKGKPGAGIEGTDRHFGTEEGDHAAIDENVLAGMAGNSDLSKRVENALENFFKSVAGSSPMEGAYVQRSISITITTVRMNVSQREEGTGDLLSSQELQSAFQEQLQNLINRFFGIEPAGKAGTDGDASGEDADAADTVDEAHGTKKGRSKDRAKGGDKTGDAGNGNWSGSYAAGSFSFELFFSSAGIRRSLPDSATMANSARDESAMSYEQIAMQFSMFSTSFSGSFQELVNRNLPDALGRLMNQGNQGIGNGPFTSLLNGGFGQFGMSVDSFEMTASGFSIKGGERRDMFAEMLEYLMRGRNNSYESDKAAEAEAEEAAEVPEEVAAEYTAST